MALYPISTSARMEPLDPPEPTQDELFEECSHREACTRVLAMYEHHDIYDAPSRFKAGMLKCSRCEEWDG